MEHETQPVPINGTGANQLNDMIKQTQSDFTSDADTLVYFEDILFQFFKCLDVKSLQTCRRICHAWEEVATNILLQRQVLRVTFYNMTCWQNTDIKLSEVSTLIQNSRLFPCKRFFFVGGNINDKEMQKFLTLNGKIVKELFLNIKWYNNSSSSTQSQSESKLTTTTKILKKLLNEQCKNLVGITFYFGWEKWEWDCDSEGEEDEHLNININKTTVTGKNAIFSSPLQCLKYIAIDRKIPTTIFKALLSAAVNLQRICFVGNTDELLSDYNIDCLIEANKLFLLKDLSFRPTPNCLPLYDAIVKEGLQQLQLDTIDIDLHDLKEIDQWKIAGNILSELFLKSCSQLTKIFHFPPLGFLPNFVIPILPALIEISIDNCHDAACSYGNHNPSHDVRIFPSGLNPKYSFPNVTKIDLSFSQAIFIEGNLINPKWDEYFPEEIIIPSVQTLTCSEDSRRVLFFPNDCDSNWFPQLRKMLPNLIHAEFPSVCDFSSVSQEIWKLECLETFEINVILNNTATIYDFPFQATFQALTGFTSDNSASIFSGAELMQNRLVVAEMERAKANANLSILDLKHLKKILICFSVNHEFSSSLLDKFGDEDEVLLEDQSIFRDVLSSYALMFCPHLDITFNLKSKYKATYSLLKVRKIMSGTN